MKKAGLLFFAMFIASRAFANTEYLGQDFDRRRPSYKAIFQPCKNDEANFKETAYQNAFLGGLAISAKVLMFDTSGISAAYVNRGLTDFTQNLIYSDSGVLALKDCMGDKDRSFVGKVLLAESAGKAAGVASVYFGLKFAIRGIQKIAKALKISALTSKRILYAFIALTTGAQGYNLYEQHQNLQEQEESALDPKAAEQAEAMAAETASAMSNDLRMMATEQISIISERLQATDLSNEDKSLLQQQLRQWELIKKNI